MHNARQIFEQIKDIEYIKDHMLHKYMENTWFDCKLKSRPQNALLDKSDKSNFAKALSVRIQGTQYLITRPKVKEQFK